MVETVKKYYALDNNCAETLTWAGNEMYGLELDPKSVKLLSAFGAGCGCGHICGALAGCLATIGSLAVVERAHVTPNFGALCAEFMAKFEAELGSTMCSELKPKYRTEEAKCVKTCELAGQVLADFVAEKGLAK